MKILYLLLITLFTFIGTSCTLLDSSESKDGTVFFNISIPQSNSLSKVASDYFELDSIKIQLTSPYETVTYSYPITGRPDTGNIIVPTKVISLKGLRQWTAKIVTIDVDGMVIDTVHKDSSTFYLKSGQTIVVNKTLNPLYTILRINLSASAKWSKGTDFIRLKVNSKTVDSIKLIGINLNSVYFASSTVGWFVGDSGRILKTINGGDSLFYQTSGTTKNLRSVWFTSTTVGYIVGDDGIILKTTNGDSWASIGPDNTTDYSGITFNGTTGYACAAGGIIKRTTNSGSSWTTPTTPVTSNLNAIHIRGTRIYSVGNNGVVLRSTDGTSWSNVSDTTSVTYYSVYSISNSDVYVVGNGGVIRKSTNNPNNNWTRLVSKSTRPIYSVWFTTTSDGYAVGDSGKLFKTTNSGSSWDTLTLSGNRNTRSIMIVSGLGYTAGLSESIHKTTDLTSWQEINTGPKIFSDTLVYKYYVPSKDTLIVQAIDRSSILPIRGKQVKFNISIGVGVDTNTTKTLSKCGYLGPSCF